MLWKDVKDKILVFGEDDYVFADMFISIIKEYDKVINQEDLQVYTFTMLEELMNENLIKIFLLYNDKDGVLQTCLYEYSDTEAKVNLINLLNEKWKEIGYRLPNPTELFWLTSDLKIIE